MKDVRSLFCRAVGLVALGCALLAPNRFAGAQTVHLPPITRSTLPNGIRVVLMEYHRAPFQYVLAEFAGGDSAQPDEKAGIADLTADLMRRGTSTRNAQQIAEQIDFLGGNLDAVSGSDELSVSMSTLSRDSDAGLDLFADIILHPTFPGAELERERQLALSGLESLGEDPGAVASRIAVQTVYSRHPYGLEPTITTLKAIARDDVAAYYNRVVVPERMILVAVGDFRAPDMLARLKARFGDWRPDAGALPPLPPVSPASRHAILIDKPDATQTQVRWIRPGIPRNSPDYDAAEVASTLLGGGFTSRLIDEIRVNRSLTYNIGSQFSSLLHGGEFGVSSFTKVSTTRALLDATASVLRRTARQGFTAAELQKAKGYLSGLFAIQAQTPESLASRLAEIALYRLPDDTLATYLSRLRAVSLPQINRVARTYFAPESLSLILVAPATQIKSQLSGLGAFESRSIDSIGK